MRTDRVQYQTKQLLRFISKGVGRYQKNDIFSTKVPESRPTDSQRQARRGYWPIGMLKTDNLLSGYQLSDNKLSGYLSGYQYGVVSG